MESLLQHRRPALAVWRYDDVARQRLERSPLVRCARGSSEAAPVVDEFLHRARAVLFDRGHWLRPLPNDCCGRLYTIWPVCPCGSAEARCNDNRLVTTSPLRCSDEQGVEAL